VYGLLFDQKFVKRPFGLIYSENQSEMSHKPPQDIMEAWKAAKAAEAAPKSKGLELFGMKPVNAPSSTISVVKHPSTLEIKRFPLRIQAAGADPTGKSFQSSSSPRGHVKNRWSRCP